MNPVVNRIYAWNYLGDRTVSVIAGVAPNAIQFINVTPCRLVDTRKVALRFKAARRRVSSSRNSEAATFRALRPRTR